MSIKLILVAWSYHTAILKLLHCSSVAVFFVLFLLPTNNVNSGNVVKWFQTMSFSWSPMVMSLSFNIYYSTTSQAVFGISRLTHLCSISSFIFSRPCEQRKTVLRLSLCLIDKSSLSNSLFLHYYTDSKSSLDNPFFLSHNCFTRVILDLGDCCKWIIEIRKYWKVEFQSLSREVHHLHLTYFSMYLPALYTFGYHWPDSTGAIDNSIPMVMNFIYCHFPASMRNIFMMVSDDGMCNLTFFR